MRIVRRAEFLLMPAGTVFATVSPWVVGNMEVKGRSFDNDWESRSFDWIDAPEGHWVHDCWDRLAADPEMSFPMDGCFTRDGGFDSAEGMFLIYESADTIEMIKVLAESLGLSASFEAKE